MTFTLCKQTYVWHLLYVNRLTCDIYSMLTDLRVTFTLYYITCVLDSVLRWLKPCIYLDTVLVICSNKPWSYSREVQLVYTFVAWIKGNYGLWSISIRIKHNGHDVVFHIVLTRECIMFCSVIIWIRPRKQLTRMLFFFCNLYFKFNQW